MSSPKDEPLPTIDGRVLSFGLELSAALILDDAYADYRPSDACRHLFAGLDSDLAARLGPEDVVTAEEITGSAETARPALAALAAAGIRALVARTFTDAILAAAPAYGIVTVVVDVPSFLHTDDRVRLDLDAGKIVNLSSGDRSAIRNLGDAERARVRVALATRSARSMSAADATDAAARALAASILPAHFYLRPTLRVARALLGKILVHRRRGVLTAGRIVEVEAYRGPEDRAAHTAGGRRTARNEVMWGAGGHLYVYFTYGMHHCCNVVTRSAGEPEAVLLRALEPIAGVALMRRRRGVAGNVGLAALARGPGNLCRAMGIDRRHDGADLTQGAIVIRDAPPVPSAAVAVSPRIGVAYAGAHALRPWRFFVRASPAVSGPRAAPTPLSRA